MLLILHNRLMNGYGPLVLKPLFIDSPLYQVPLLCAKHAIARVSQSGQNIAMFV